VGRKARSAHQGKKILIGKKKRLWMLRSRGGGEFMGKSSQEFLPPPCGILPALGKEKSLPSQDLWVPPGEKPGVVRGISILGRVGLEDLD